MAVPHTPWGAALDELMADGAWRTLDELVDAAGSLIPPGVAHRRGEAEQARLRPTGTGPVKTNDDRRDHIGRRRTIRDVASGRTRHGTWERRHDDHGHPSYRLAVT